ATRGSPPAAARDRGGRGPPPPGRARSLMPLGVFESDLKHGVAGERQPVASGRERATLSSGAWSAVRVSTPKCDAGHGRRDRCRQPPVVEPITRRASSSGPSSSLFPRQRGWSDCRYAMAKRSSLQMLLQHFCSLVQCVAHGWYPADRVQQTVVVNEVLVMDAGYIHAGGIQVARVRQTLFAKNIVAGHLNQGGRKPLQLPRGRLERRGVNFATPRRIGSVRVPKPHHHSPREKISVRVFVIGLGSKICVRDWPKHDLTFEF